MRSSSPWRLRGGLRSLLMRRGDAFSPVMLSCSILLHDNIFAGAKFLGWMCRDVSQHQFADTIRHLIGDKMAATGKYLEAIGRRDEINGAFGGRPAHRVVGIAPDIERRHADQAERRADRASGAIPGKRSLHCGPVAEYGEMLFHRSRGHAGR